MLTLGLATLALCIMLSTWLILRASAPDFFEEGVELSALLIVPVVAGLLPFVVFSLRHALMPSPSVVVDELGLFVDCNMLGPCFLPWMFIRHFEMQKGKRRDYLVVEIDKRGMERLGAWKSLLLSLGIGGRETRVRVPETMIDGDLRELAKEMAQRHHIPFMV